METPSGVRQHLVDRFRRSSLGDVMSRDYQVCCVARSVCVAVECTSRVNLTWAASVTGDWSHGELASTCPLSCLNAAGPSARLLLLVLAKIWLIDKMRDDWMRRWRSGRSLAASAAAGTRRAARRWTDRETDSYRLDDSNRVATSYAPTAFYYSDTCQSVSRLCCHRYCYHYYYYYYL